VAVLAAMVALAASMLVSYTRARAEGLGIDCKVGFAARAERLLALGLPALVFGAGPQLYWIVVILALATVVTVVQRVVHVARVSGTAQGGSRRRRETVPARIPATGKGAER
jgi:CDP-diacylglycerol--glycerol-3-phosphate 3-phosphatidyltransferase